MNLLRHRDILPHPAVRSQPQITMSTKTKGFIQKICNRNTASVDMTKHGFVNDKTLHPVNVFLKPLREQLEKIWGKHVRTKPKANKPGTGGKGNGKGSKTRRTRNHISKKMVNSKPKGTKNAKSKILKKTS